MTQVIRADDGTIWETRAEAKEHEKGLKRAKKLADAEATFRATLLEKYQPVFDAAPDCRRLLNLMVGEPEVFIEALSTFDRIKRKMSETVETETRITEPVRAPVTVTLNTAAA